MRHSITAFIAVAVVTVTATVVAQRPTKIDAPQAGVTVPMGNLGGRPVVDVKIDGQVHSMILDTGASRTIIDPAFLNGRGDSGALPALGIGALTVYDLPTGYQRLQSVSGSAGMPGVLSAGAFPGYLLTLDYPGKTISIVRGTLPAADGKRIFEYDASHILPVVPVVVAGRTCVIHVDSGAPTGVMLPMHYAKELPLVSELTPAGHARTVAGEFDVFAAPVKGAITLGEFTLDVPSVRFSDLRPGPMPGIGHIGGEVLKTFRLTFDSANRRLRFER
ncbi:MAG TPA: hypothetical protein VFV98_18165 [Vicinamibacterales bacterium]|nr:hypothetical protein [Vicinamibacterales bacterium]